MGPDLSSLTGVLARGDFIFALGMGRADVEPGELVRLSARYDRGNEDVFRVELLVFLDAVFFNFVLQRVTLLGAEPAADLEILTCGDVRVLENQRLGLVLRSRQGVELVARNVSGSSQVFAAGLYGVVEVPRRTSPVVSRGGV